MRVTWNVHDPAPDDYRLGYARGVVRSLRFKSPFDVMFLLSTVLIAMVNWKILLFPKDVIRGLMMVPLLLPVVVAGVDWLACLSAARRPVRNSDIW